MCVCVFECVNVPIRFVVYFITLGGIALRAQAIAPHIPTPLSGAWSVPLSSVVCHIRALCLNRLTDLDTMRQVHLWGSMTRILSDGVSDPQGKGRFGGRTPSQNIQNRQSYAAAWRIRTKSWMDLRFRLLPNHFTLVLVLYFSKWTPESVPGLKKFGSTTFFSQDPA